jgi:hypothetical protein
MAEDLLERLKKQNFGSCQKDPTTSVPKSIMDIKSSEDLVKYLKETKPFSTPDIDALYTLVRSDLENGLGFAVEKLPIYLIADLTLAGIGGAFVEDPFPSIIIPEVFTNLHDNRDLNRLGTFKIDQLIYYINKKPFNKTNRLREFLTHESTHAVFFKHYSGDFEKEFGIPYKPDKKNLMHPFLLGVNEAFAFWKSERALEQTFLYEDLVSTYDNQSWGASIPLKFYNQLFHRLARENGELKGNERIKGDKYVADNLLAIVKEYRPKITLIRIPGAQQTLNRMPGPFVQAFLQQRYK